MQLVNPFYIPDPELASHGLRMSAIPSQFSSFAALFMRFHVSQVEEAQAAPLTAVDGVPVRREDEVGSREFGVEERNHGSEGVTDGVNVGNAGEIIAAPYSSALSKPPPVAIVLTAAM